MTRYLYASSEEVVVRGFGSVVVCQLSIRGLADSQTLCSSHGGVPGQDIKPLVTPRVKACDKLFRWELIVASNISV